MPDERGGDAQEGRETKRVGERPAGLSAQGTRKGCRGAQNLLAQASSYSAFFANGPSATHLSTALSEGRDSLTNRLRPCK